MNLKSLAIVLALALPVSAQQFGVGGQVVSGGVTQQWFGYGKPNGTSGPGVYMTPPRTCVGWWDPASAIWGGKDSAGVDDFADADSATPVTESSYPIVIFGWAMLESVGGASACLLQFGNTDGTESFSVATSVTGYLRAMSTDGGVSTEAATAAGAIVNQTPFRYVVVFESTTSRAVYCNADTTGGTNTTSSSPAGIDRTRFFGWRNGTTDWGGNAGPTHVFANATVPSADQRTAFLRDGHDPELIMGTRATALWMVGSAPLTDQRGSVTLSVDGDSVADTDDVWCVPDASGQNNAIFWAKAVAGASVASRVTSALNGQVSTDFNGTANSGLRTATDRVPATQAPIQLYVVVDIDTLANNDIFAGLSDDSSTNDRFDLRMNGAAGVFRWLTNAAGVNSTADSSLSPSVVNTPYLGWGAEITATDRRVEVNGGNAGSNSTSRTPTAANIDHFGIMAYTGSTATNGTDGQLGLVLILNTTSIAGQPSIERFTSAAYALGF